MQNQPPQNKTHGLLAGVDRRLLGLLLAVALLYGLGLGRLDLWAPDEPRYGAIAEEVRSGRHGPAGLFLLHLNDVPYTQKPPLYFWLAAAAGAPMDRVDEAAARLPSALAGLFSVGLTAWIGRRLLRDPRAGWIAAALLATSFRFAFTARRAQLDVLLTAFELIAIAIFLHLEFRAGGIERVRARPAWIAAVHLSLGAAALVKGPVGWLPLLVFAAYLVWQGRARSFRALVPIWSWLLSVGPVAAWILVAIALAPAGFAQDAVGENLLGRFFAGTSHARPFYYFAYQLPLDFLPWSLLAPAAIPALIRWLRDPAGGTASLNGDLLTDAVVVDDDDEAAAAPDVVAAASPVRDASRRDVARFLICWIAVPLLFFSLSAGKRGLYLLPVFPALALVGVFACLRRAPSQSGEGLDPRRVKRLTAGLVAVALLELGLFHLALPQLDSEKSPRPVATATAALARPGERVGVYGMSPLEGGITYYARDAIEIVSLRTEAELRDFLGSGGRLVLLRARHLETLGPPLGLTERQSFRSERRRLSLAEASD